MILGITTEDWIDKLGSKKTDGFFSLVDKLVIVSDSEQYDADPYYYVKGDYKTVCSVLRNLSLCKAYSQKTLFSANFSLVELVGKTPEDIKEEWCHELRQRHLV